MASKPLKSPSEEIKIIADKINAERQSYDKSKGVGAAAKRNYPPRIKGQVLEDIGVESTYLLFEDVYLLNLAFKQALGEREIKPLFESLDDTKVLWTVESSERILQPTISLAEMQTLLKTNREFQGELKRMLDEKDKFTIIIASGGLDDAGNVHLMNINFEQGKEGVVITISDSMISELSEVDSDAKGDYEKRLSKLFTELLKPKKIKELKMSEVELQSGANCGIHALINKINHEYELNLDPKDFVIPLRNALKKMYSSYKFEDLVDVIKEEIKKKAKENPSYAKALAKIEGAGKSATAPAKTESPKSAAGKAEAVPKKPAPAHTSVDRSGLAETSGWYNNCGLHCIAHFLIGKITSGKDIDEALPKDEKLNKSLQELATSFAEYYNIDKPKPFLIKDLREKFNNYTNPQVREMILAPVLREFMKKALLSDKARAEKSWDLFSEKEVGVNTLFELFLDAEEGGLEQLQLNVNAKKFAEIKKEYLLEVQELRKQDDKDKLKKYEAKIDKKELENAEENLYKKVKQALSDQLYSLKTMERPSQAQINKANELTAIIKNLPDSYKKLTKEQKIELLSTEIENGSVKLKYSWGGVKNFFDDRSVVLNQYLRDKYIRLARDYWISPQGGYERYINYKTNMKNRIMTEDHELTLFADYLNIGLKVMGEKIESENFIGENGKVERRQRYVGDVERSKTEDRSWNLVIFHHGLHWEYEAADAEKHNTAFHSVAGIRHEGDDYLDLLKDQVKSGATQDKLIEALKIGPAELARRGEEEKDKAELLRALDEFNKIIEDCKGYCNKNPYDKDKEPDKYKQYENVKNDDTMKSYIDGLEKLKKCVNKNYKNDLLNIKRSTELVQKTLNMLKHRETISAEDYAQLQLVIPIFQGEYADILQQSYLTDSLIKNDKASLEVYDKTDFKTYFVSVHFELKEKSEEMMEMFLENPDEIMKDREKKGKYYKLKREADELNRYLVDWNYLALKWKNASEDKRRGIEAEFIKVIGKHYQEKVASLNEPLRTDAERETEERKAREAEIVSLGAERKEREPEKPERPPIRTEAETEETKERKARDAERKESERNATEKPTKEPTEAEIKAIKKQLNDFLAHLELFQELMQYYPLKTHGNDAFSDDERYKINPNKTVLDFFEKFKGKKDEIIEVQNYFNSILELLRTGQKTDQKKAIELLEPKNIPFNKLLKGAFKPELIDALNKFKEESKEKLSSKYNEVKPLMLRYMEQGKEEVEPLHQDIQVKRKELAAYIAKLKERRAEVTLIEQIADLERQIEEVDKKIITFLSEIRHIEIRTTIPTSAREYAKELDTIFEHMAVNNKLLEDIRAQKAIIDSKYEEAVKLLATPQIAPKSPPAPSRRIDERPQTLYDFNRGKHPATVAAVQHPMPKIQLKGECKTGFEYTTLSEKSIKEFRTLKASPELHDLYKDVSEPVVVGNTLTVNIPDPREKDKVDVMKRSYEIKKKKEGEEFVEVSITLSPNPSDKAILVMLDQNRAFLPLDLQPYPDLNKAVKVFEAALLKGMDVDIDKGDEIIMQNKNPKLYQYYAMLKAIKESKDEKQLDILRQEVIALGADRELGDPDDLPKKLADKLAVARKLAPNE